MGKRDLLEKGLKSTACIKGNMYSIKYACIIESTHMQTVLNFILLHLKDCLFNNKKTVANEMIQMWAYHGQQY